MDYLPPEQTSQHWMVAKPAATGRGGIVASQSRAAAEVGVAVLNAGGNAIDAAVAAAFALATVEPWNSGLGGIGFALVHRAGQPRADVVDFGPMAPRHLDASSFKMTGRMKQDLFAWPEVEGDANIHGPLSFAIPAAVAGYAKMHETWGKLPVADVLTPAVALAKRGLPQDWFTLLKVSASAAILRNYPESARIYLPNNLPPIPPYQGKPGFFQLGQLPKTLERLQHAGLRDFYEGEIAASIIADTKAMGGVLCAEDLRDCTARIQPAMQIDWRGRTLELAGGLTAAPTMARVVEQMRAITPGKAPDAAWFSALARAMRTAYAERLSGLGDTEPKTGETCTTHLTVCDGEGTMVAITTTLLSSMGSRVVLPESGVLMNNGVMWFDPRPDQPNSIAPGKRPLTNMCPVIMLDNGRPWIAAGSSGGRRILASVYQTLAFAADFNMNITDIAQHPRIDVSGPDSVTADRRLSPDILAALAKDNPLEQVEHMVLPVNFACPNIIMQNTDGTRSGITDAMSPWSAALAQ